MRPANCGWEDGLSLLSLGVRAMRAMLLRSPRPVEETPLSLAELPDPKPGPGQVLIRVSVCGLCHTDLHTVEGELPPHKQPLIPGHQVVGTVQAAGDGVSNLAVGDRVGVPWLHQTCGVCEYCLSGRENLCERALFTGLDVDGGYAKLMVAPEAYCYRLPDGYPDVAVAPLLCAGIIGYRALRLSEVKPGQALGLYGFGASAHIALQVARYWGCRCYVFTRSQNHRTLAQELGAVWTGAVEDAPPEPLHSAISFAPAGRLVPLALRALRPGGTLALASIYMDPIPSLDYTADLYRERTLRSVTAATRQDARELLALAPRVPIQTQVQVYPLTEANAALSDLKHSRLRAAGVLQVAQ